VFLLKLMNVCRAPEGDGGGAGAGAGGQTPAAPAAPVAQAPVVQQAPAFSARSHMQRFLKTPEAPQVRTEDAGKPWTHSDQQAHDRRMSEINQTRSFHEGLLGLAEKPFVYGEGDNALTFAFSDAPSVEGYLKQVAAYAEKGFTPQDAAKLYHFDAAIQQAREQGARAAEKRLMTQRQQVADASGTADGAGDPLAEPKRPAKQKGNLSVEEIFAKSFPEEHKRVMKDGFNLG